MKNGSLSGFGTVRPNIGNQVPLDLRLALAIVLAPAQSPPAAAVPFWPLSTAFHLGCRRKALPIVRFVDRCSLLHGSCPGLEELQFRGIRHCRRPRTCLHVLLVLPRSTNVYPHTTRPGDGQSRRLRIALCASPLPFLFFPLALLLSRCILLSALNKRQRGQVLMTCPLSLRFLCGGLEASRVPCLTELAEGSYVKLYVDLRRDGSD